MDKLANIRSLLEKFYNGSSSTREEQELIHFFSREEVSADLLYDRELFLSLSDASEPVEVPESLHEKILSTLDNAEQAERRTRRINFYTISGLAAGLLIIISVYTGYIRQSNIDVNTQYAIEDPEKAYLEAKKTLEFVSSKWNEGTSGLKNLDEVNKTMETISSIKKISSGSKELNLLGNLKKAENIQRQ